MNDALLMMKELTEAPGISGDEGVVRQIMRRYLEPLGSLVSDNLGSIAAMKVGDGQGPRIAILGHLDEIGLMVKRITDDGFLKFQTVGGWWEQVMLAQQVRVQTRNGEIVGVIGSKPPHILEDDERKKPVKFDRMFIDIGASSKAEAEEWGVRPGDSVVPYCPFTPMRNEKLVMAKAWDNRFGCALAIEVLKRLQNEEHPNIVYGGGTVQEEVGLRGATTFGNVILPDIAFALDTGIAGDTPGTSADEANEKLGKGPVVFLHDGGLRSHPGLRNLLIDTANELDIPLQFDVMARGATDAGRLHVAGAGAPALSYGVPVRYIHTAASILNLDDFEQAASLLVGIIKKLDMATVRKLKNG